MFCSAILASATVWPTQKVDIPHADDTLHVERPASGWRYVVLGYVLMYILMYVLTALGKFPNHVILTLNKTYFHTTPKPGTQVVHLNPDVQHINMVGPSRCSDRAFICKPMRPRFQSRLG